MSALPPATENEPPRAHARVVYLGPVSPHWEVYSDFGDRTRRRGVPGPGAGPSGAAAPRRPPVPAQPRAGRSATPSGRTSCWSGTSACRRATRRTDRSLAAPVPMAGDGAHGRLTSRLPSSWHSTRRLAATRGWRPMPSGHDRGGLARLGRMAVAASERLLNRELSWLDFNARVLALADDAAVPLLERVKFAAIFSSNLDEFFQVRVAALKDQVAAGITAADRPTAARRPSSSSRSATAWRSWSSEQEQRAPRAAGAHAARGRRRAASSWDDLDEDDRKHLVERVRAAHLPGADARSPSTRHIPSPTSRTCR